MLRMFKGDKSFIPKNISASQFMIVSTLMCITFNNVREIKVKIKFQLALFL